MQKQEAVQVEVGKPPDYFKLGEYRLKGELKKIDEELGEPNRGYALDFKRHLEVMGRDVKTVYRRLHELRYCLRALAKDAKSITKEDAEALIIRINSEPYADLSKAKLKRTFKVFYERLTGDKTFLDWLKPEEKGSKKRKLPEDMLSEEEVKSLINACRNVRDRAVIALLWDAGLRAGELLKLGVKDIEIEGSTGHAMVSHEGKTGARRVPLTFSPPYLATYLNQLRSGASPTDALFVKFDANWGVTNNDFDYKDLRKLLINLKRRLKGRFKKRLYPHLFRHSRATFYANKLTEQQLKVLFGWTGGSDMPATYVHLSGRDIDDAIFGRSKQKEAWPMWTDKLCIRCRTNNEPTATYCKQCNAPLDLLGDYDKLRQELADLKGAVLLMLDSAGKEVRQKIADALQKTS